MKPPNHKSYRTAADELFMKQFRGQPCEVCAKTQGTCGHHVVPKSRSKALRYDINNILVLCPAHHMYGNDLAPHSKNQIAVERFLDWFRFTKPDQWKWTRANERLQRKYSYKQAVENLKAGRDAWE